MGALIITIGLIVLALLASRYGVDSRMDDTRAWWHDYRHASSVSPTASGR